jgi:hypothetical protein
MRNQPKLHRLKKCTSLECKINYVVCPSVNLYDCSLLGIHDASKDGGLDGGTDGRMIIRVGQEYECFPILLL